MDTHVTGDCFKTWHERKTSDFCSDRGATRMRDRDEDNAGGSQRRAGQKAPSYAGSRFETVSLISGGFANVNLKELVRNVPNFPKPGIVFRDIMPMLADAQALRYVVDAMFGHSFGKRIDRVVSPEARGF